MAFTSRSVNLSWAPPFNAEEVGVTKYLIEVRAGEDTPWSDSSIVTTPDNVTLYQVCKQKKIRETDRTTKKTLFFQ